MICMYFIWYYEEMWKEMNLSIISPKLHLHEQTSFIVLTDLTSLNRPEAVNHTSFDILPWWLEKSAQKSKHFMSEEPD